MSTKSERTISCRPLQCFGWLVSLARRSEARLWLRLVLLGVTLLAACATDRVGGEPAAFAPGGTQPSTPPLPVEASDAVWGKGTAAVTIIAFIDFECPYCARGYETLTELQRGYGPDVLRVVFKHAPLPFHPQAEPAARAARVISREVGSRGVFEFAARCFEEQGALGPPRLREFALDAGVRAERYDQLIASPEVDADVQRDLELAARLGVEGVPTFFVNGASLVGARPIDEFRAVIDHERRASAALLARGLPAQEVYAARVKVNLRPARDISVDNDQVAFVVPVGESPAQGPADAWVTIVEFADLECAFCQRAHATIEALMERHPGKLRWVIKQNPLDFHPLATPAAILTLEIYRARGATAYFEALEHLLAAPRLEQATLDELAASHGLEPAALQRALARGAEDPRLILDRNLAMDLLAEGTPHFFVNGRRVVGARPLEHFERLVLEEFAKVEGLRSEAGSATPYERLQASALPPPGLIRVEVEAPGGELPSAGPLDAPVVVQMFSDYECGYCRGVMTTLDALRQRYPEQVRVVMRQLPLSFHPQARAAASAALEVRAQKGDAAFWQMTDRLFGAGEAGSERLDAPLLERYAAELGLDMQRYAEALRAGVHDSAIERDVELASRLRISGTPTFVINGYQLVGAQPLSRFSRLVELALDETKVARSSPD